MMRAPVVFPGILEDIHQAVGQAAALAVAREKGGHRAWIPKSKTITDDHWLAKCCGGVEQARIVCDKLGSGHILVPLATSGTRARGHEVMAKADEEGRSAAEMARLAGVSLSTAKRHRRHPRAPRVGAQTKLDL
ncbi:MAG: hypothetical protein ACPGOY_07020 [Rhodospirillaceae bacterium]